MKIVNVQWEIYKANKKFTTNKDTYVFISAFIVFCLIVIFSKNELGAFDKISIIIWYISSFMMGISYKSNKVLKKKCKTNSNFTEAEFNEETLIFDKVLNDPDREKICIKELGKDRLAVCEKSHRAYLYAYSFDGEFTNQEQMELMSCRDSQDFLKLGWVID